MTKNKLILSIIWVILLIIIIILAFNLKSDNTNNTKKTTAWNINIWILGDDKSKFSTLMDDFKKLNSKYKNKIINVESFNSFEDYYYALASSISKWQGPDMFVLNNGEKTSIFSDQILWISPDVINPNDFRKKYKWIFSDDLIVNYTKEDWTAWEVLAWIPVWYETLWIFYNRRYIKDNEIKTISWLNSVVSKLRKSNWDIVPIWIWNWSTVDWVADIITQFFVLEEGVKGLADLSWGKLKQSLTSYFSYGDTTLDNAYNSKFTELKNTEENNITLFSKWEVYMVMWFPRIIDEISRKWFSKNFLLASPFPHYFSWQGKTYANYNYFVINKDTIESELANSILMYLSSDLWAEKYLEVYPYYLPALLSLESDKLEQKINPLYNIILKDFYIFYFELWGFDRWMKNIYDKEIIPILDNQLNYLSSFEAFKLRLLCKTKKAVTLLDLSSSCEKK